MLQLAEGLVVASLVGGLQRHVRGRADREVGAVRIAEHVDIVVLVHVQAHHVHLVAASAEVGGAHEGLVDAHAARVEVVAAVVRAVEHTRAADVGAGEPGGDTTEIQLGPRRVEFHAQHGSSSAGGGTEVAAPGDPARRGQPLQKAGRVPTAGGLAGADGREVGACRATTDEDVACGIIVQHDGSDITTGAAAVAHPDQRGEVGVHPEDQGIIAARVGVGGTAAGVLGEQVGAGGGPAYEHVTAGGSAQVVGQFSAVATDHTGLDAGAGGVDLQHEDVVARLGLLINAAATEPGSAEQGEVGAAGQAGDVKVPVQPLLDRVRVVVVSTADVGLPDPGAGTTHGGGLEVFTDDDLQVAVGRFVEGAQGDVVGGAHHSGQHVDGPVVRVHPDAMAMVVAGTVRVHPGGPAQRDGVDHQRPGTVVGPQGEADHVALHGVCGIHALLATLAALVDDRRGEEHLTQACGHHQFTLVGDTEALDALQLELDVGGVASGFADDIVLQCTVLGRVIADIGAGIDVLVPHLLEAADAGGMAGGIAHEVVGGVTVGLQALDAHGGQRPAEVEHPAMSAFAPQQRAVRQTQAGLLLDAMPFGLAGADGLRVVGLHQHAFGRGQGLAQREVGPEPDVGVELPAVLREVDALLVGMEQGVQAVRMSVMRSVGRRVRHSACGREHQGRQ